MNLDDLYNRWVDERPEYEACAKYIGEKLKAVALQQGIRCTVTSRAKEVDSLLKKQIRYKFPDPWTKITDKAGVRLIVPYELWVTQVCYIIRDNFDIAIEFDNKVETLGHDRLGYQGIHVHVKLREGPYAGLICEVQIHTGAQHLWSAASHDMFYKTSQEAPPAIMRRFNRLTVLMELFDKEVSECREKLMEMPNQDSHKLLRLLENQYLPLVARDYDQDLSLTVISGLKKLYNTDELNSFDSLIANFVSENHRKLESVYSRYKDDPRHVMMFQPEALLVFERSRRHKMSLKRAWTEVLPIELLTPLTTAWGA